MAVMAKKRPAKIPSPKEIREIREDLNLTQAEAAAKVGIARRTWMYYESGKQSPSLPIALLIRLLAENKL